MALSDSSSHTVREIWQQPATWLDTAAMLGWSSAVVAASLDQVHTVVFTGSGSSEYVGTSVTPALEANLGIPVLTVGAGTILTAPDQVLPTSGSGLLVSIARSGDSPESAAAIDLVLARRPQWKHLVITCNRSGRIANEFSGDDRVRVITLDDKTNDRSLVMTSSFTNLALAARFLGAAESAENYKTAVSALSHAATHLLEAHPSAIEAFGRRTFSRAVYLGTGSTYGAAREAALKMLEMTGGRVATLAETYLGLRHGPLTFIHDETLVICFLSSSRPARSYEVDLIGELNAKHLGAGKLIVGEAVPADLLRDGDYAVECPGLAAAGDDYAPVVHAIVGQLLALSRCLAEQFNPDAPSAGNVINRVVPGFRIHREGV